MIVRNFLSNNNRKVEILLQTFLFLTIELIVLLFPWCFSGVVFPPYSSVLLVWPHPLVGRLRLLSHENGTVEFGFYCTILSPSSNWLHVRGREVLIYIMRYAQEPKGDQEE